MSAVPPGPVAVLVVHAWIEEHSAKPLRVTIRRTTDASAGFTGQTTVAEVEAALGVIRDWLEEVLSARGGEVP